MSQACYTHCNPLIMNSCFCSSLLSKAGIIADLAIITTSVFNVFPLPLVVFSFFHVRLFFFVAVICDDFANEDGD